MHCRCFSYLFWSDGTYGSAKIERSDLSGNNRTVLVSSAQGLASPTTLVVDFSSQKLYWLDSAAQKIGRVNFDGSELFTQIISSLSQVSAMTVYRVRIKTLPTRNSSVDEIGERYAQSPISEGFLLSIVRKTAWLFDISATRWCHYFAQLLKTKHT